MVHERLGGRRSIRLPEYDYSQDGAYFVTICTQNKEHLFGEIASGKMILNDAGRMIDMWWQELPKHFVPVQIDQYVIMPNHVHGVIVIVGVDRCVDPRKTAEIKKGEHVGSPLPHIVQWYKTMTTNEYIKGVKTNRWRPFARRLWQRNYYEHVIRNEYDLNEIRKYIIENPLKWALDEENPERDMNM